MSNLDIWDKVCRPPKEALKQIGGGRLKGMTDVNPQWRYKVMTEVYGPIGTGWYYEIDKMWTDKGVGEVIMAFVTIRLFVDLGGKWSAPIVGIGGSALVAKEKDGFYSNDEAYKMATTDALSVAMKSLGVAADIYAGLWDGSKYKEVPKEVVIPKITPERIAEFIKKINDAPDQEQKLEIRKEAAAECKAVDDVDSYNKIKSGIK